MKHLIYVVLAASALGLAAAPAGAAHYRQQIVQSPTMQDADQSADILNGVSRPDGGGS